jgi:deazaflavin-dependent oxidoreductase (nitroreductase family)
MYSRRRQNRMAAFLNRGTAAVAAAGIAPRRLVTLEVRGRRSGRRLSVPVVLAEYGGQRYLVAMLGSESNWVRNVRAAGGQAVLRHGRHEDVRLEEVDPAMRAPILQCYLQLAPGARAHFPIDRHAPLPEFERIAELFPVFRVCAASAADARLATPA